MSVTSTPIAPPYDTLFGVQKISLRDFMVKSDGRFSIGCWIDPHSMDYPDHEEFFDTRGEMEAAAKQSLRGKYESAVLYEWHDERDDWIELDEWRRDDVAD